YSRFDEHPDDGVTARLLGCGYFRQFVIDDVSYDGRAIFGILKELDGGRPFYAPAENDEAHALAGKLGFRERRAGQSGTSILIVDPLIEPAELLEAIEKWWWPALVEQSMDVAVTDYDGS